MMGAVSKQSKVESQTHNYTSAATTNFPSSVIVHLYHHSSAASLFNPLRPGAYLSCSLPFRSTGANYVQMPSQGRLKNRLKNKFNHLLAGRSRSPSPSPNCPIMPTLDPQASSTPVSPETLLLFMKCLIHNPLNSPSLSKIYPSIVIDSVRDEAPGRMADLASAVFQGVRTTLRLVERATNVFLPLKSTVAGLLGVIDIVEVRDF